MYIYIYIRLSVFLHTPTLSLSLSPHTCTRNTFSLTTYALSTPMLSLSQHTVSRSLARMLLSICLLTSKPDTYTSPKTRLSKRVMHTPRGSPAHHCHALRIRTFPSKYPMGSPQAGRLQVRRQRDPLLDMCDVYSRLPRHVQTSIQAYRYVFCALVRLRAYVCVNAHARVEADTCAYPQSEYLA